MDVSLWIIKGQTSFTLSLTLEGLIHVNRHIHICMCIYMMYSRLYTTFPNPLPLVVYSLAIHYSPFVLETLSLSFHNSCLGQGTVLVRKSAYYSFVLQYLISTSPLTFFYIPKDI